MKRIVLLTSLLCTGLTISVIAQSNQSPTLQQSTSVEDNRQANPPQPKIKKPNPRQRQTIQQGLDTTSPKNRRQRRLPPDSLRRGGATRVDTVR